MWPTRKKNVPEATLSLWEVAEELSITPQAWEVDPRFPQRRRRRSWNTRAAQITGAVAILGSIPTMIWAELLVGFALLILGLLLLSVGTVLRLSAAAYRRVARWLQSARLWAYFVLYGIVLLGILAQVIFAVSLYAVPGFDQGGEGGTLIWASIMLSLLILGFTLMVSVAASPLLVAVHKPRPTQIMETQRLWTGVLVASIVTLPAVGIRQVQLDGEVSLQALTILLPIAVAVLGSVIAWHRRGFNTLEQRHALLITAFSEANLALASPHNHENLIRQLRALRRQAWTSPLRNQSPIGAVAQVSWEIAQVTDLLLWAAGDGPYPDALKKRERLEGNLGLPFIRLAQLTRAEVLSAGQAFTRRCQDRLYGVDRAYTARRAARQALRRAARKQARTANP